MELVSREAAQKGTQVTVVLPRRGYAPLLGRICCTTARRTRSPGWSARCRNAAATIIPFDVESRVHLLHARQAARARGAGRATASQAGQRRAAAGAAGRATAVPAGDGDRSAAGDWGSGRPPFVRREPSRRRRHRGARTGRPRPPVRRDRDLRDHRAERRAEGDRGGQGPGGGDPPGREQLRVRGQGRGRERDADRQVLRPDQHPRLRAGRARPARRARCPCARAARP